MAYDLIQGPSAVIDPSFIHNPSSEDTMQTDMYRSLTPQTGRVAAKPFLLGFRSSKVFILTVVCIAVFTDTFFYTLIIPILPDELEERAGVPHSQAQKWISILLATYAAANLIMSPIAGIITDRSKTRRMPLLLGLVAMIASTTLYTFGRQPAILVTARALQGASAAVIRVGGLSLITDTFGPNKSGAAMGWQSVGMFLGTVTGPSLSGLLYDNFGHYAVFTAAYVVLAVDILLRLIMIERKVAAQWLPDAEVDDLGEHQPIARRDRSPESAMEEGYGSSPQMTESCADIRDFAGASADGEEQEFKRTPILLQLLMNRRLLSALWATFTCAVIMTALESVVPLYAMQLFSWTPTQTGILLIALAASIVIDPLLGALTDKYGSRWFSFVGFCAVSLVYLISTTITHNQTKDKVLLCALLVILGFAIGSVSTPNMVEISLLVHSEQEKDPQRFRASEIMGQAYAMLSVSYGIGSLVGPVWGGAIIATHGWVAMCTSFTALGAFGAVIMLLFAGSRESQTASTSNREDHTRHV